MVAEHEFYKIYKKFKQNQQNRTRQNGMTSCGMAINVREHDKDDLTKYINSCYIFQGRERGIETETSVKILFIHIIYSRGQISPKIRLYNGLRYTKMYQSPLYSLILKLVSSSDMKSLYLAFMLLLRNG